MVIPNAEEDPFVTSGSTLRAFDKSTPRPPTPPRESPRLNKAIPQTLTATANNQKLQLVSSPASSRDPSPLTSSAESASEKPKKKQVGWSAWTTYHKPDAPLTPSNSRVRPSASTDPKSLKSILKHSASPFVGSPTSDQPFPAHTHASFTSMLESVVQALASTERSKKLDAYISFCNTLRAYDDVPDWNAMEKKVPILCGYLKRDLVAKLEEGGNADSQLSQQATKLLTIICWYERLVSFIDDQSASFFIQNATQKIEDPQTSKASITLYLHFLAQQRFAAPKMMTAEKVNRIITALETLDERVTGKSITKERIDIYYKLLSQARPTMIARAADWMRNAFGGLLNHIKEVRTRSLIFLREAAMVMGKEKTVARTISAIFNQDNEGKRMFESIRRRLDHFVKKEQEGQYVSQLWGVLLLLTQSVGDKWDFFTPWLRIIETCFNVSEPEVKVEAQLAWSKLIYVSNIGPTTQRKLLELMCKPVEQYLDPRNASSNTRKPRKAALSNVCVYLYYGFRPNAVPKQLSEIWDVVVVGLIQNLVLAGSEAADGCNILCSLFDGSTTKRWTEDRLLVGHPFMKADEVPRLDPKWVRLNCDTVLKTVEVALHRTSWEDSDTVPGARLLWKRFTRTIADAGSKEIKIVPELMEAVSHLFNMFQRMWSNESQLSQSISGISFIERFTFLVEVALNSLGTLCFTEKQLAIDDKSKFVPAATPTHKYSSDSNNGYRYPPLLHIFRLLMDPPPGVPVDELYFNCARRILAKCCSSQDSRRKKLHLLASCESLLPRRDISAVHLSLWDILAELTRSALPTATREKALLSPSPLGGEFKDAVTILKWGSQQHVSGWESLFQNLIEVIQSELSEAYVSVNVIGPLAESLRQSKPDSNLASILHRAIVLLEKANHTKKKPSFEGIFKGHHTLSDRKPANTDSLESLYVLTNSLLLRSYESPDKGMVALGSDLCKVAIEFIARAPVGSITPLKQIQEGLGVWVKDTSRLVSLSNGLSPSAASKLWEKLLQTVESLPQHDSEVLFNLNVLLSSGFESRRKATVNSTLKVWNETFGKQQSLSYPSRLRTALAKLKTVVDVSLPEFPEDDSGIYTPPEFADSQDGEGTQATDDIPWSSPTPVRQLFPDRRSRTSSPSGMIMETPFSSRSKRSFTPKGNWSSPTPTKSRPKLKHMDSQIDFVPIQESPSLETQDSQLITEHQKEVREEQAQAAALFPELMTNVTPKPRRTLKIGRGSPSSQRHPAQTHGGPQTDQGLEMVLETAIKANPEVPIVMTSFVSDSQIGSFQGSQSPPAAAVPSSNALVLEGSSELTELDSDSDVPMPNYDVFSLNGGPYKPQEQATNSHSDELTGEDHFVDASDHFNYDEPAPPPAATIKIVPGKSHASPPKKIPEIAISIPPVVNSEEYEVAEASGVSQLEVHGPDAQIVAEVLSAAGSPVPPRSSKMRPKKRKRGAPTQDAPPSPEVLDTIVIATDRVLSPAPTAAAAPPPQLSSPDHERPHKRARANNKEDNTPRRTRVSARKTKGKKPPPRASLGKVSASSDLEGTNAEIESPTPMRTRALAAMKRPRAAARTPKEPPPPPPPPPQNDNSSNNTSFVQETQLSNTDVNANTSLASSSVPDSQAPPPPQTLIGPTPTKGRKPRGLFTDDVDLDELQVRSPRHSLPSLADEVHNNSAETRSRSKRRSLAVAPPPVSPARAAIEALRQALGMVDSTEMTIAEIATVEDEVFEAFSKLRAKKKRAKQ